MHKTMMLAAAAALVAVSLAGTSGEARAERDYPYCAYAGGRNGFENCGYYTLQQCLVAMHGVGGHCQVNPRYFAHRPDFDRYGRPLRR